MADLQQSTAESECAQKEGSAALLHHQPFVLWQVSGYSLLVQAVDSGTPAMSSTATVNIDISDVNDNSPVFTPANYTAVIQVSSLACQALVLRRLASCLCWGLLVMVYYGFYLIPVHPVIRLV